MSTSPSEPIPPNAGAAGIQRGDFGAADVLIVDEALSVGDTTFSMRFRSDTPVSRSGTTLLFVSHSPGAIKTLCDSAILLDQGVLMRDDSPDAVLDYYNARLQRSGRIMNKQYEISSGRTTTRSDLEVTIESATCRLQVVPRARA
jgi:lipopolysaccharide transport system ATP-binding protein